MTLCFLLILSRVYSKCIYTLHGVRGVHELHTLDLVVTVSHHHIVARPVRKKTNWVFAVGRLTACDALAASLCGLVVRVGECGEVSKACAVQRAASAVVSSSPFVQQASLGSSSGGWMTPAAGWNLSRPHNGRQWLNRSVLTYSRGSEPLALRRRAQ